MSAVEVGREFLKTIIAAHMSPGVGRPQIEAIGGVLVRDINTISCARLRNKVGITRFLFVAIDSNQLIEVFIVSLYVYRREAIDVDLKSGHAVERVL